MATYTQAGYVTPGQNITVDGVTVPVVNTDILKLNGVKQTIGEWIRRGRLKTVSVVVNVNTYYVESPPEKEGQTAGV